MKDTTHADEVRLSSRYQKRDDWADNYDYKTIKGGRFVELIKESGGIPRLAVEIGVGRAGIASTVSAAGARVFGFDLSADILQRAKAHAQATNVGLLRASGFALPFQTGSLPLIYASQVLHLFDSPSRLVVMREAHRVLQPGGRFIFDMKNVSTHLVRYLRYSPDRRRRGYPSQNEIVALLRDASFGPPDIRPGVLPLLKWTRVPNTGLFRILAHTTFFIARRA